MIFGDRRTRVSHSGLPSGRDSNDDQDDGDPQGIYADPDIDARAWLYQEATNVPGLDRPTEPDAEEMAGAPGVKFHAISETDSAVILGAFGQGGKVPWIAFAREDGEPALIDTKAKK